MRNRLFTTDARWVLDALPVADGDFVLDVAAGTGQAARQLAAVAHAVIALDGDEAMLRRGSAAAAADALTNVVFMRHDVAEPLPFAARSFEVCVCRFVLHHLEHPEAAVAEMTRVTRGRGHLALVDVLAVPDPRIAAEQDRLEGLRDPSHTHLLSAEALHVMATEAGLEVVAFDSHPVQRPVTPWLAQAQTPRDSADEIEAALVAEAEGHGSPTGLGPGLRDGELWFTQTFAALIGRRPAG